jgi:arginyl-tRNA synthetase
MYTNQICGLIQQALQMAYQTVLSLEDIEELVETPPEPSMGDYALPCFSLARVLRKSPKEIACQLQQAVPDTPWVKEVKAVNGYLNFFIDPSSLAERVLNGVFKGMEGYGPKESVGCTLVIDYSSPNIAKPFTLGHIRSTVIGESLARIFAHQGYQVVRVNHLGDWGTQFGKLIVAYKRWGDEEKLKKEPIKELFRLYVKFHEESEKAPALDDEGREWFKRLEDGDQEALALWKRFREYSLEEFERTYSRLGIKFDDYKGESGYNDAIPKVIELLKTKGLLTESQGAWVVELEEDMPPLVALKKDGATLYATRDLAAAMYRKEVYDLDLMFYVVDTRQTLHFRQVFATLKLMGYSWAEGMEHIPFGTLNFGDEVMSTRKGNVIFLEDVLDESVNRVKQVIQERNPRLESAELIAEQVGVGAVIFNDLVHNRIKDISFNWENVLNFEGDTGPYLQYTQARACSILRKSEYKDEEVIAFDLSACQWDEDEINLIKVLSQFPGAVEDALKDREPSVIARYLLDLGKAFNTFYHNHRILGVPHTEQRLAITYGIKKVLAVGLNLLGLNAPEEM